MRASRNHSVHRGIVGNHLREFLRDCFCLAVGGKRGWKANEDLRWEGLVGSQILARAT